MKQLIGSLLSIAGLIGVLYYGYQYLKDSKAFGIFGADIAVSTGDYVPVLISAIVLVAGIVIYRFK